MQYYQVPFYMAMLQLLVPQRVVPFLPRLSVSAWVVKVNTCNGYSRTMPPEQRIK